ncbi:MAG: hypothetical protein D6802_03390 [Ardenticatenia bacterium]|nr:MAG: hypothetical protein D6802_03390 [Ardenticatenia bacterium]
MSSDQNRFPNCRFFHYDYLRGHERMECRLLRKSGYAALWNLKLCETCPVPRILQESTCRHLVLEAEIVRKWGLFPRVKVFAVCSASLQTLDNPLRCPHCEAEEPT